MESWSEAALWLSVISIMLCVASWFMAYLRTPKISPDYERESYKRRNLDRIRARSGQFPKPYPNGWYRVCGSSELPKGRVLAVTCCGKEMVVFRGQDGKVGILDAFCPHLGTHLGHGGTVVGNNLVCPYHSWEFDCNGKNHMIPYCSKDMSKSTRVNAKKYECRERLDIVFVWYHANAKSPPTYELTVLDEVEDPKAGYRHIISEFVGDWGVHVMEPSHNSADWYHFKTVHKWLCQDMLFGGLKLMFIEHGCDVTYGTDSAQSAKADPSSADIHTTCYELKMFTQKLKLFGVITMPSIFNHTMDTIVKVQGPQTQMICMDLGLIGKLRMITTFTPEAPFRQRVVMTTHATRFFPYFLARLLMFFSYGTFRQDLKVWEHKSHISPRNLVAGDGPFGAYGKWLEQFYSEDSVGFEGKSLDW